MGTINSSIWTEVHNPAGDGVASTVDGAGQLSLYIPGVNATHDIWPGNFNYLGIFQDVLNTNFDIHVKVDSTIADAAGKLIAIVAKIDDSNLIRVSISSEISASVVRQRIFAHKILAGTNTNITSTLLATNLTAPFYLRFARIGNGYTFYTKQNLTDDWTSRSSFTETTLAISKYGLAVGNILVSGNPGTSPTWAGLFDYFLVDPDTTTITGDSVRTPATSTGSLKAKVTISGSAVYNTDENTFRTGLLTVNPPVVVVIPTAPGTIALPYGNKIVRESSKGLEFREQKAQYGDGKMQSAPDGINASIDTWNVTWGALTLAEKLALEATLATNGTWGIYSWTPCNETAVKYFRVVNKSIKIQSEGLNGVYSMSVDLQQDFSVS